MADELAAGSLRLRAFGSGDLHELHAIFSDPSTHTIGDGPVRDLEVTRQWLGRRDERRAEYGVTWYAVRDAADQMIGNAGLFMGRTNPHPEFGFEIRHADQGHGYGTAAARVVIAEAHRIGFSEVWATVRAWNAASLIVLGRIGFIADRTEQDARGSLIYLRHTEW